MKAGQLTIPNIIGVLFAVFVFVAISPLLGEILADGTAATDNIMLQVLYGLFPPLLFGAIVYALIFYASPQRQYY